MIKVYSTPTCPWCIRVKQHLASKKVAFEDINVAADFDAAREMIQKSGQRSVPVVDINGEIIVGFDQERIDSLVKIS